MTSIYDSEHLAAGYAFDRPPIHEQISGQTAWTGTPIRP